jgi:hypothetical protein
VARRVVDSARQRRTQSALSWPGAAVLNFLLSPINA